MSMHYPVFCYNGQFRRGADGTPLTYMLHGHIHKSEDQVLVDRFSTETRAMMRKSAHQETAQPVPCQMINCFCMYSDYTPLTYMLHGHIHKSEDQVLVDRFSTETRAMMRKSAHQETAQPVPCQMINCFCMYSDYTPLTLEEWVECDQRRRDKADR